MDSIAEDHFGAILFSHFLGKATLLELPAVSRGSSAAVAAQEDHVWELLEQREITGRTDIEDGRQLHVEPGDPGKPSHVLAALAPKQRFRVAEYMAHHQVQTKHDALRHAADRGHRAVLRLLIQAEADPNMHADSGAHGVGFTQVGAYPLHLAAKRGFVDVLEVLVAARAEVDAMDQNGRSGLMIAVASGKVDSTRWLVDHRADVNLESHYGLSPLHTASQLPRPEVVSLLLRLKAAVDPISREGRTPMHLALNALPQSRVQKEVAVDLSGMGDEYCYTLASSSGYNHMGEAQEASQEVSVKRSVTSLLLNGADPDAIDGEGRSARAIVASKRRPAFQDWFEKYCKTTTTTREILAESMSPCSSGGGSPQTATEEHRSFFPCSS